MCVQQLVTSIAQNLEPVPDNNLSAETKLQNGVTQGAVFFHLASGRKSASIV